MRIAVHAHIALSADGGAFGIGDARVDREPRRFAGARELHRRIGRQVPRVMQVEIGNVPRQLFRIRKPRAVILGRVAGDGAGLLHRLAHGLRAQVRGARGALALAEVHRDGNAAVPLILHRVHFAQPHGGGQAAVLARLDIALRGAPAARFFEREAHHGLQFGNLRAVNCLLHVRIVAAADSKTCAKRLPRCPTSATTTTRKTTARARASASATRTKRRSWARS